LTLTEINATLLFGWYFLERRLPIMGYHDRVLEEKEIAQEVAIKAGYLARCGDCSDVYDPGNGDPEPAYKLANSLITKKDPLVEIFWDDRTRLTDLLKDLHHEYPGQCHCDDLIHED